MEKLANTISESALNDLFIRVYTSTVVDAKHRMDSIYRQIANDQASLLADYEVVKMNYNRMESRFSDHVELIDDYDTITECMSFVRSETGRPQAADGAHDDTVIALAIAYYSRGQQRTVANVEVIRKKAEWTADMWDDWRRADAATRAMLEAHWGNPR